MAHPYWRLYFPNSVAGGPGHSRAAGVCAVGVEFRATQGGAAEASTAQIASSVFTIPGFVKTADKAILPWDGVNWWQTDVNIDDNAFPAWLQLGFAAPLEIEEIVIVGVAGGYGSVSPARIVLQYSDDGATWTSKYFWNTPTPWVTDGSDVRVFNSTNDISGLFSPELRTLSLINYPAEQVQATEMRSLSLIRELAVIRAQQVRVLSLVRGRTKDPRVRAWTFSMDGHDFYVLRLGDTATLVYDLYSEQWVDWATLGLDFWRMNVGNNWNGGNRLATAEGSNVVVGDDTLGLLWFLDPNLPYDDHPRESVDTPIYFERITQGQVPIRGREVLACYATWLTTDMGAPAYEGAGVKLEISDDAGKTYFDAGTVEVTIGAQTPQIAWYSLGQIGAPGRLFKITDDGAVARIDGLEMNDPDDDG